jgi:hypothetical protein
MAISSPPVLLVLWHRHGDAMVVLGCSRSATPGQARLGAAVVARATVPPWHAMVLRSRFVRRHPLLSSFSTAGSSSSPILLG